VGPPGQADGLLAVNFLSLTQAAVAECGASGTVITTTLNQTGENLRFVNWVIQAWTEIQNANDEWGFMRSSYLLSGSTPAGVGTTFPTTANLANYPLGTTSGTTCMVAPASFAKWDEWSFRNYSTVNPLKQDEIFMDPISYDDWRDAYMLGSLRQVQTRPIAVAIGPDMSVCVGPPSNGSYTIEGDYWVAPQIFANDADTPQGLQIQYHMMIVYKVMMKYAGYEAAPEVLSRGQEEYVPMFLQLAAKFGPRLQEAAALA
jgi:hypothetical protein